MAYSGSRLTIGTAVELCCGMGGIGIGLAMSGYDVVSAYDCWPSAVRVYNHNAAQPVAQVCDILADGGMLRVERDRRRLGEIDVLAAGPPCQGFSQIRNGRHDRANPHNRVLLAMPDYVALLRPRLVLVENVPDVMRFQGGDVWRDLLCRLERPGPKGLRYRVEYGTYDAALYGTPQARRRVIVLAVRLGSGPERLPDSSPDLTPLYAAIRHGKPIPDGFRKYAERLADPGDRTMTNALQALSDLPALGPSEPEMARPYATPPASAYQRSMRAMSGTLVTNTCTPSVRPETLQRLALIPPGGCARDIPLHERNGLARRHDSAYRRLHPGAPSTALSTRYDCVYHHERHRSLSVREYARLQGIPDHVSFPQELACRRHAYEMIGNSVPPMLIHGVVSEATHADREGL